MIKKILKNFPKKIWNCQIYFVYCMKFKIMSESDNKNINEIKEILKSKSIREFLVVDLKNLIY